ncbi:MAG: hypothetical protein ABW019_04565 [Chitinophagaceae bacterium]
MNQFRFTIKDKRAGGYSRIASLLFLVNAIVFFMMGWGTAVISQKIVLLSVSVILLAYALYTWLYRKKKDRSYLLVYLLLTAVWTTQTPFWYFGILFLVLLLLQHSMDKELVISLSATDVVIAGLTRRSYPWASFNNIVLKDGLLTLDFTNDRVIQAEPAAGAKDYTYSEKEFNEFCREQLKK